MTQEHKTLPENYRETFYLNVSDPGTLATLNTLSLWGLVFSISACLAWILIARIFLPSPVDESTPSLLISLILVIGVLPFHELMHGIIIQFTGYTPRYGAKWVEINDYLRLPYLLYATTDHAYFTRWQFIAIALAPLVVITILGFILLAVLPYGYSWTLSIALIMNGSGSVGDVWMTWLALKSHPQALIKDEADAIRIYEPES